MRKFLSLLLLFITIAPVFAQPKSEAESFWEQRDSAFKGGKVQGGHLTVRL
jgi:hypothetical protein